MSKLVVHAKIMIDGVSDTPKKDQLISIEDGKIVSIEEYHETNEEVIHANVVTPGFLTVTYTFCIRLDLTQKKNFL